MSMIPYLPATTQFSVVLRLTMFNDYSLEISEPGNLDSLICKEVGTNARHAFNIFQSVLKGVNLLDFQVQILNCTDNNRIAVFKALSDFIPENIEKRI